MPSTIPRASMNDEQWVSTFGTANNIGQGVEVEFKQTQPAREVEGIGENR